MALVVFGVGSAMAAAALKFRGNRRLQICGSTPLYIVSFYRWSFKRTAYPMLLCRQNLEDELDKLEDDLDDALKELSVTEEILSSTTTSLTLAEGKAQMLEDVLAEIKNEKDRLASERDGLASERDGLASERDCLASEKDRLASERDCIASERDEAMKAWDVANLKNQAIKELMKISKAAEDKAGRLEQDLERAHILAQQTQEHMQQKHRELDEKDQLVKLVKEQLEEVVSPTSPPMNGTVIVSAPLNKEPRIKCTLPFISAPYIKNPR
eukprot:1194940-Prorocentrum_minimum.AAC.11